MKIIVKMTYGSHLYGTATPASDIDIKGIYLPSARDILLQRIKPVIVAKTNDTWGEKNSPYDIDCELYSPERFLTSVAKGQSFALEMLFAPDAALVEPAHPLWNEIKQTASLLLTKQAASIVNYCKQQAYKYCQKGLRVAAAKNVLALLLEAEHTHGSAAPLSTIGHELKALCLKNSTVTIEDILQGPGVTQPSLHVAGKRAMFNASIKNARIIVQNSINEYGQRALQAELNEGIDWKALSHAVRIGHQALEFLIHQRMTFPRPESAHLRAIKAGSVPIDEVYQEIEQLLSHVQEAEKRSSLPLTYDQTVIDTFIEKLYRNQVVEGKDL
jgi:hypothetical protein